MNGHRAKHYRRMARLAASPEVVDAVLYGERIGTRRSLTKLVSELQPDGTRKPVLTKWGETFTLVLSPACLRFWHQRVKRDTRTRSLG